MTESGPPMKMICLLLLCACVLGLVGPVEAAGMLGGAMPAPQPQAPSAQDDPVLAAKCKAASFARRPAGQMATTMRVLQIERCIKNKGFLE
jgi:hypothetical protein